MHNIYYTVEVFTQVNTILHSIEQQIEVLKSEKRKPVDPVQTQKIEQILETQFTELEKTISTDASVDRKVIAETLTTLDRELQRNSFISAEKIKSQRTEISTIKNTLDHSYQPADVRMD